jgi:hypothetical protein
MEVARDSPSEVLRTVELPRLPTFLPFLLQASDDTPMTPIQLLHRLLDLRNRPEVAEYRRWWARLRDDLDQGVVTTSTETELREIAAQLRGRLGLDQEHDAALSGACAVVHPNGHGNEIARRTGLYLPGVAGHGHRKVLMDLVLADRATKALDRRLLRVWKAGLG